MGRAVDAGARGQGPRTWLTAPLSIRITSEGLTWAAVAVGVVFRLLSYINNRPLYMDERSLLDNLVRLPVFDFHTTLTEYQLAPPGFLALERMLVRLPGSDVMAARSFPLACGIASMFLFRAAARRFLLPACRPDRRGSLRAIRLADLLLVGDEAILVRPGPDPDRALAGGGAGVGIIGSGRRARPVALVAPAVAGAGRLRRDRCLVLVSAGAGARGSRDLPARRSR